MSRNIRRKPSQSSQPVLNCVRNFIEHVVLEGNRGVIRSMVFFDTCVTTRSTVVHIFVNDLVFVSQFVKCEIVHSSMV